VERAVSLSGLQVSGGALYWNEGRPAESGRQVVVRWAPGGDPVDVLPTPFSARTTVHEYGGGAFWMDGDTVLYANFSDQRVYRDGEPITPDDGARYADGNGLVCVRERHLDEGVVNDIVLVPDLEVVAQGHDFYAAPRWSPDGRLAWLAWDHPNMPWDGTVLEVDGEAVAGGPEESITQPRWSPDGRLHWISDRTGWWNIYREGEPLWPMDRSEERRGGKKGRFRGAP